MIDRCEKQAYTRCSMTTTEAARIVDTIITSLGQNPTQFQIEIEVNAGGQQITSYRGVGLAVSATGGGPGSTVIGQVVTAGGNQIEIAQKAAVGAMNRQMQTLLTQLTEVRDQLQARVPDKSRVQGIIESLKNTWVPTVITNVLSTIITACLGI
jgi:Na+-transporting NADH:ubiquinone oxidoreductase subunit NqrF